MQIIHFEKNWGLADKPAGLSVHNDPGHDLVSLLSTKYNSSVHLINRLDSETSGLVLFSLIPNLVEEFQKSLSDANAEKKYHAVLRGQIASNVTPQNWNWSLTDKAEGRKNPQGEKSQQKECLTQVRLLEQNNYFSWVECRLLTGRQHQIRKHAVLAGHAIVGDRRYGEIKDCDRIQKIYQVDRLFLHCRRMAFSWQGKFLEFNAEVPPEFAKLKSNPTL